MLLCQVLSNSQFTPRYNSALRCVVVSDCAATRQRLTAQLGEFNWDVRILQSGVAAIAEYHTTRFVGYDVIFMSVDMAILNGELTTRTLVQLGCSVPIFLLTADPDSVDAVGLGAMGAVALPLRMNNLVALFIRSYHIDIGLERAGERAGERGAQIDPQGLQVVTRDVVLFYCYVSHDGNFLYRLFSSD